MFSVWLRIIRSIIHFILIIIIFLITYHIRLYTDFLPWITLKIPQINEIELIIFSILSALCFIFIWIIKKLYELYKPTQNYFQTFTKVRLYRFISITFIAFFWKGFIFSSWISRFIIVITSVFSFFVIFFFDQIWNYIETKYQRNSNDKILIIAKDTNWIEVIDKIKKWFSMKSELIFENELKSVNLKDYKILIAVWSFSKEKLQQIFESIRLSETRFYHISEWYFLEDVIYIPENINNIIVLEYKHSKLDWRSLIFKRIFDIIWSIIFIILSFPIMIIIWLLIKLDSKWPILYFQKRIWENWKEFTFVKFRSMYTKYCIWKRYWWEKAMKEREKLMKSDKNIRKWILQKIQNDPRITKIWKIIRKLSLDELPSLFSVLIWDMSLIWPRPHMPNEIAKYKHRQKRLLSIKPWITWYAQIFGRDNLKFDDEARLDLYYIQNRTIFLDIYILFATLWVVFKGK